MSKHQRILCEMARKAACLAPVIVTLLLLTGCTTVSPPTSATPVPAPPAAAQSVAAKGSGARLVEAAKVEDASFIMCAERITQGQINTALGFVRCWSEPAYRAYQQSDLLIMDLVEQRMDAQYKAAVLFDHEALTVEQFMETHKKLVAWFFAEIGKRFAGQFATATPAASPPTATLRYK